MKPGWDRRSALVPHVRRYLIAGVLTLLPLWVTWLVFNFLFTHLSRLGKPWVQGAGRMLRGPAPALAEILLHPWFGGALALVLTLVGFYLLGWATTRVIGKRLLGWLELLLDRIPLVKAIYGSVKRLVTAFQTTGGTAQRVVLIGFPSEEMRTVALVTRTLMDRATGEELAVVFVPTSPNPTSGYIEIVPMVKVVPTDWTLDDAMRFIISGGTNAPGEIDFALAPPGPLRRPPVAGPIQAEATDRDPAASPPGDAR
jgi:uncharacterized membrane protein